MRIYIRLLALILSALSLSQHVLSLPIAPTLASDPSSSSAESDSDTRSLYDIIWGCLVTIAACTWVTMHPDLLSRADRQRGWWYAAWDRARASGIMFVIPELVMGNAIGEWMEAYQVVQCARLHLGAPTDPDARVTMVHGFMLEMGGFVKEDGEPIDSDHLEFLDWNSMPPEDELADKSKSDGLGKFLAVVQTTWFVVGCIARRVLHFEVTQLEVLTLAFASLNGILYALWWFKPQDVSYPSTIRLKDSCPNKPSHEALPRTLAARLGMLCVTGIIFGGLHCLSWNSSFPSDAEATLWRIAALAITLLPLLLLVILFIVMLLSSRFSTYILSLPLPIWFFLYVAARLIIIALAFTTLRKLPDSAFQDVQWTTFIPHI